MEKRILLAGAGPMALDYAKVLKHLDLDFTVVGRGKENAEKFGRAIQKEVATGGIEAWIEKNDLSPYSHAIVAVGERQLGISAAALVKRHYTRLLIEKPGGFTSQEIHDLHTLAGAESKNITIGYNRRFYASVQKAREIIRDDGGVKSFFFEFTEWSHKLAGLTKEAGVLENWFFHNSSHVIDLAFFLGGKPAEIETHISGRSAVHPRGLVFTGSGVAQTGALFAYQANWAAPGRWGVEMMTDKHRLLFKPLETLQSQVIGSLSFESVPLEDACDKEFKPGLLKEVQAFINGADQSICTLPEQVGYLPLYRKIGNIM